MRSILLSVMFIAASLSSVNAQQAPAAPAPTPVNPNAADFQFEAELHDFGTIKQGDNGTYEFKFKNIGKEPLIISGARGSCGCTVPSWPKEPIMPGANGVIKVTYDTQRVGVFTKTVTINSNAKSAEKIITIKGKVDAIPAEDVFPGGGLQKNGAPYEKNN